MVRRSFLPLLVLALALLVAGCQEGAGQKKAPPPPKTEDQHAYKPGRHGGYIRPLGLDKKYHVEVVFEKNGVLRLFTLGQDMTRAQEFDGHPLTAHARPVGTIEAEPFELEPVPLPGDKKSKTSQFAGTLPESVRGSRVEVRVSGLRIGEEHFRFTITSPRKVK